MAQSGSLLKVIQRFCHILFDNFSVIVNVTQIKNGTGYIL